MGARGADNQQPSRPQAWIDACIVDLDGTQVDTLGDFKVALNRMLADNTGRPYKDIVKATERDNFLTPEEAKELGIIDRVLVSRNEMAQEKSE